jgi:RNA polymerase sigma factor (sigma-70 family)
MPQPVLADVLHYLGRICQAPGSADLTDAELLERFLAHREETAFALLVQRYGPMVLGVSQRVLGNADSAEDVFQATFLVLVRQAASIRKKQSVASWLYGVAQRIAARARGQAAGRAAARLYWERRSVEMARKEPLDELTWQELRTVLDEEIGRLPEKYRAPLVLCYFKGCSHDQAAQELGWPKRSLTSRVCRGRELLRKQLVRRGIALSAGALASALCEKAAGATVGARLTINTVQAVTNAVTGKTTGAGCFSARATILAEEAMKGNLGIGSKFVLLAMVLGLAAGGAGLAGYGLADKTQPGQPDAMPLATAKQIVTGEGKKDAPALNDLFGDPLPEGALARLGTVRFRLGSSIYRMALSPDGQTAVAVAGNAQTQWWDVATGKAIRRIDWKEGGGGRVIAYSPDGRLVASVQDHGTLHLWDAATGKRLAKLELKMNFAFSLGFSPDSTVLAVGGGAATYGSVEKSKSNSIIALWQWDGSSLKPLWEAAPDFQAPLGPRSHHILSLAFSPDGKHLATGGGNNSLIRIWNAAEGKEIRQFKASGTQVGALAFSPTSNALASGSGDGALALWNPASATKLWENKQPGEVRALAFAPDGKTLAVGGGPEYGWFHGRQNDPFLVLLDADTGKDSRPLAIARDSVASVGFSKDGKVLAAGLGGALRFWDGTTGKERSVVAGHENWISAVAVSEDGQVAVTAGGDGLVILWDLATGKEKQRLKGHLGEVRGGAFVPGGKLLASASTDQTVRLWDLATGKEVRVFHASPGGFVYALAVSQDGKMLAAGDYLNGSLHVWNLATGQLMHKMVVTEQSGHGIMRLAFSPDGKVLVVGETVLNAKDQRPAQSLIILLDAVKGKKLREFPAHTHAVLSLAISPDGTVLASTGWSDKTIKCWDLELGKKILELPCASGNGVATFSADGKILAWAGSPPDGIVLWEMASKKVRHKFIGHPDYASYSNSLAFSSDGKRLVTSCSDTTGLVWDVTGLRGSTKPLALAPDKLTLLWKSLASADAAEAGQALWALAADPKQAVPFIAERLRGLPAADRGRMQKLLAELDSKDFKVRQAAQKELHAFGKLAEPALRDGLARKASLEVRQRIEKLLEKREDPILAPEVLQVLRAIEVLEHAGSPEARLALEQFAKQTTDDYYRQEARAAALRLGK